MAVWIFSLVSFSSVSWRKKTLGGQLVLLQKLEGDNLLQSVVGDEVFQLLLGEGPVGRLDIPQKAVDGFAGLAGQKKNYRTLARQPLEAVAVQIADLPYDSVLLQRGIRSAGLPEAGRSSP